jgi:Nucleotidyl transferase AbiEii toxin, Type IV TA system
MAGTSTGSTRWPTSDWQGLLRDAIRLVDTLKDAPTWTFGGGTALAVLYEHRISYDIDIFLPSADALTDLSPTRNPVTKELLGAHGYQFPGNYLKLELGRGEIDFILAGRRTDDPSRPYEFEGRRILLETPWESAIKKIFYRSSTFKIRDVFDVAAVIEHDGERLKPYLGEVEDKLARLLDRIDALAPVYEERAKADINPTDRGRKYMSGEAIESIAAFIRQWRSEIRPSC